MAIRQRFEPIGLRECLPKLTATVVVVVSVEVDADRVLTLGSPRPSPGPRNTATVHILVEVDLEEHVSLFRKFQVVPELTPQPPSPLSLPKCATVPLIFH